MPRSLNPVMRRRRLAASASPQPREVAAAAAMYDAHVEEVYRFVHRRRRDHALAEDITQETFMAAIRNTTDPTQVTIGWLITVARNRLIDVLRREANYEGKLRLVGADESAATVTVDLAERLRIEAALNELSVDHRLVLTLRYVDGYTVPALARHLGRSVKSVEGLLTRARREMRMRLDEDVPDIEGGARG